LDIAKEIAERDPENLEALKFLAESLPEFRERCIRLARREVERMRPVLYKLQERGGLSFIY
jgi:hypothetical protein